MQRAFFYFFIISLPCLLFATQASRRITAHCIIKDFHSACLEGREAVLKNEADQELWRAYIGALASRGLEKEMMRAYRHSGLDDRQILEVVAWGVLNKGAKSEAPMTRIYALVASLYSGDIQGANIIYDHLNANSALHRFVAVQLASEMRDTKLKKGVLSLLEKERNPLVRLQAIEALGKMHYQEAKPLLLELTKKGVAVEKAAAVGALALIFDEISEKEMEELIQSDRAPLRSLACQLATRLESHGKLIAPLIHDSNSEVRASAITAATYLGIAVDTKEDLNDLVAIRLAWSHTRAGKGTALFEKLFKSKDKKVRVRAAAALAAAGRNGIALMQRLVHDDDSFVVMNIALGLIGQRIETKMATQKLAYALKNTKERMMWSEELGLRTLMPSDVIHQQMIPQYPEAVNQATRLEILNVLAVMNAPEVVEGMKQFLREKVWGISGMASALLLTEGDEELKAVVEDLLNDPNQRIRIQSALVLALWGRSQAAIDTLEKSYSTASRDVKEKILEGIGRVGDERSIPFLVEKLEESHQTLRVLAAMSLLQCLYH